MTEVQQNDQPQQSNIQKFLGFFFRMFIMFQIMQYFKGKPKNNTDGKGVVNEPVNSWNSMCSFQFGDKYNLFIYVTEFEVFDPKHDKFFTTQVQDQTFGNFDEYNPEPINKRLIFPETVYKYNQSLYLHTFLTSSTVQEPSTAPISKSAYRNYQLTPYKRLKRFKRRANLLTGKSDIAEDEILEDPKQAPIVAHFHQNLTINVIYDTTPFVKSQLVPPLTDFIKFNSGDRLYEPTILINNYWNLQKDYMPINDTLKSHEFSLTIYPLSMFKFQMYASQMVQKSWMKNIVGEEFSNDSDQDTMKEMLINTNIWLVATTFVVSILHMIFEFLAFKNDIQFWNSKKDGKNLEGLSIRAVFTSIVQSVIVFLYILDNDANTMIIINIFIGMLIDVWKIKKVLYIYKTSVGPSPEQAAITNTDDKDAPKPWKKEIFGYTIQEYSAYRESPTKKYDRMAFKYLGYVLVPLFVGYAIYSLLYNEHKNWYSFILGLFYGFLLVFGFIMMTPQLFINYKLKSVAHLPWRMLTYKFINTFIDDLFAFVIKMPTLYRLGCFRDDIVFLIFLYQKWIYKVDYSRTNEFGTTGEELEKLGKKVDDKAVENGGDKVIDDKAENNDANASGDKTENLSEVKDVGDAGSKEPTAQEKKDQ